MKNFLNNIDTNIVLIKERGNELFPGLCDDALLTGGKRLRAMMFFVFCGNDNDEAVRIATAIELLHAATLIHDDILDSSGMRRGKPALYKKHGIPGSLLFGDYLFSSAFSLIADLDDRAVYGWMTDALGEVLSGEITESFKKGHASLSKEEYFSIIEKKSGVLFGLSCGLGAKLRGLAKREIESSYLFGIRAGMGYQIMDDYLDYFGESRDKERFKDFKGGVVTLPLIYLLQRCAQDEKVFIESLFNDSRADNKQISDIVSLMSRYGVPESISDEIGGLTRKASKLLPLEVVGDGKKYFDILKWLNGNVHEYNRSGILTE